MDVDEVSSSGEDSFSECDDFDDYGDDFGREEEFWATAQISLESIQAFTESLEKSNLGEFEVPNAKPKTGTSVRAVRRHKQAVAKAAIGTPKIDTFFKAINATPTPASGY